MLGKELGFSLVVVVVAAAAVVVAALLQSANRTCFRELYRQFLVISADSFFFLFLCPPLYSLLDLPEHSS